MSDPQTQNPNTVHIDEGRRIADFTVQWRLERDDETHPSTACNALEVLICGREAFERIARDIEAAEGSIDLVCWGFDPGMELVRGDGKDRWPRGQPFGSLLHAAVGRGVKVRLLVWYDRLGSAKQNNMPGYSGDQRGGYWISPTTTTREDRAMVGIGSPPVVFGAKEWRTDEQARHDYCVGWWREVMESDSRIELKLRSGSSVEQVRGSLALPGNEEDPPSSVGGSAGGIATEKMLLEQFPTHHQKTILIDYAWEEGSKAVGYVMGLNSVTDYWDSEDHPFDTPLREIDWARKSATAAALPSKEEISRDPYQDYASRIRGPALQGVHRNFVQAWSRAGGTARPDDADRLPPKLAQFAKPGSGIQIVRTQPEEGPDKTIKKLYWQAASNARNYIYIENQYFYYEAWVRHLKKMRAAFMKGEQLGGVLPGNSKLLHLFVVIPWPEDDGMIPRTYDMVKSLGEGESMPNQHEAMRRYEAQRKSWETLDERQRADRRNAPVLYPNPVYESARRVEAPVKNHVTGELQGLGMKVLIARLVSQNKGKPMPKPEQNFRQIYIHSKLMLIDDAVFTLGSANLNVRSMAVDSELNMVTDDHLQARTLRQRVWGMHADGYGKSAGGGGSPTGIRDAFDHWKEVMGDNQRIIDKHLEKHIKGFIVPFKDKREIYFRHG